jgi:hypothetical protein
MPASLALGGVSLSVAEYPLVVAGKIVIINSFHSILPVKLADVCGSFNHTFVDFNSSRQLKFEALYPAQMTGSSLKSNFKGDVVWLGIMVLKPV